MKKVVLTVALFSALLINAKTETVHAIEKDDTHGTSIAKVGLTKQDNTDNPTDPLDPDGDGDESSNDPTGNTGALRIDYVSNIDFGSQKISSETKKYTAVTPAKFFEAQVSDLRGNGAGWNLQVSYDSENPGFVSEDGTVLAGAELKLPAGTAKSALDNQSQPAETAAVTVNAEAQNIMTASKKAGLGTWEDQMDAQRISLKVPSGNLAGNYSATLVWTLTDAPSN